MIGINKAIENFDVKKSGGAKFTTYAYYAIRSEIIRELENNSGNIHIPRRVNSMIKRVNEAKMELNEEGKNETIENIFEKLKDEFSYKDLETLFETKELREKNLKRIDCTKRVPEILRYGAILEEDIRSVVGDVIAKQTETRSDKYKHYQPEVPIWLVHGSPGDVQSLINQKRSAGYRIGVLGSEEYIEALKGVAKFSLGKNLTEIAQSLYAGFRHFQKDTVDLVIIESFPKEGIGKTIMNRIEQAATKII